MAGRQVTMLDSFSFPRAGMFGFQEAHSSVHLLFGVPKRQAPDFPSPFTRHLGQEVEDSETASGYDMEGPLC